MLSSDLAHGCSPTSYVGQRRCDLAEQSFHEAHKFDPASWAQLHERLLLVEQAWLEVFGFWGPYWLFSPLIRTGESLGAHRRSESDTDMIPLLTLRSLLSHSLRTFSPCVSSWRR